MNLKLNTWQRVTLSLAIGQIQGNLRVMFVGSKALESLELTPSEQEEVGLRLDGQGGLVWDDTNRTFDIEIPDECKTLLQEAVKGFEGWPVGRREDIEAILQQIDLSVEDLGG